VDYHNCGHHSDEGTAEESATATSVLIAVTSHLQLHHVGIGTPIINPDAEQLPNIVGTEGYPIKLWCANSQPARIFHRTGNAR
jgi:hypothetical protein